jgi:hypothetical protein
MASKKFFFTLDLAGNQIKNQGVPQALADAANKGYVDDNLGTAVTTLEGTISALEASLAADLASAVSDLEALVSSTDAAARNDIQGIINGLPPKKACSTISVAPITLSGLQTIDGYAVQANNRVLVAGQGGDIETPHADNGIYVAAAGAWARADDLDAADEMIAGMFVPVNEGTNYGDTQWFLVTDGIITPGTTAIRFDRYGAADAVVAGDGLERDGHTLSVKSADEEQLTVTSAGVGIEPTFIAYLLDLANSTNNLETSRIIGLLAYIRAVKLNEFTAPDGDVNLASQKLTNLAAPTDASDAATLGYVQSQVGNRFFNTTIGDGAATTYTVAHGLSSKRVIVQIYNDTTGATVEANVTRTTLNDIEVVFDGVTPAANEFAVLVTKVA